MNNLYQTRVSRLEKGLLALDQHRALASGSTDDFWQLGLILRSLCHLYGSFGWRGERYYQAVWEGFQEAVEGVEDDYIRSQVYYVMCDDNDDARGAL